MAEFYSYLTNPAILAPPLTPNSAIQRIKRICQMPHIDILTTPPDLLEGWMGLVESHPVTNGQIFDLLHIAIMLSHGIKYIYTFNADDFNWCDEIEVINPSSTSNFAKNKEWLGWTSRSPWRKKCQNEV